MAKIWVTNSSGANKVPFLRGILTSSLIEAGLSFDEAYKTSSALRQQLDDVSEISLDQLRERVADYLENKLGTEMRAAYEAVGRIDTTVQVRGLDDKLAPFSRMQHLNCLESCGLSDDQATETSAQVIHYLNEEQVGEITSCELGRLTFHKLIDQYGAAVAHRYLVWVDHARSGRPLVMLIGGATGSGKSTIATEVAHRLGIVRTQSTDMLREVMRMMIPERLLPVLHTSSFNAGGLLPASGTGNDDYDAQLADGYLTQSELLSVPCEAVIQRALRERVSIIVEGVHLQPALLQRVQGLDGAIVVMVMLALLDPDKLHARLANRLSEAPKREGSSHLSQFDKIWRLQSFLLSEADRKGVPILENSNKEKVVNAIMATIIDELARSFDKTPEEVFQSKSPATAKS